MLIKNYFVVLTVSATLYVSLMAIAEDVNHSSMDHSKMQMGDKSGSSTEMQPKESMNASKIDHKKTISNQVDHSKMDHSGMKGHSGSAMSMDSKSQKHPKLTSSLQKSNNTLKQLSALPVSGVSREAGSDGRYAMESTSILDDIGSQCAKAGRGLVILDIKTWEKCASKPKGLPIANSKNVKPMDHSMHMKH